MFFPDALPAIPGCDGVGTVIETGAAASRLQAGDDVWFCHGGLGGAPGNYAEITVLEESAAEPMPPMLGFEEAAALPLIHITAREALFDRAGLGCLSNDSGPRRCRRGRTCGHPAGEINRRTGSNHGEHTEKGRTRPTTGG